jgi:hypothetical protein
MLNVKETRYLFFLYKKQKDFLIRTPFFLFTSIIFLESIRGYAPDVELLINTPATYVFCFLVVFLILMFFSSFLNELSLFVDAKKVRGVKRIDKLLRKQRLKSFFLLTFTGLYIVILIILPCSLDSITTVIAQQTNKNYLSFEQIGSIEIGLFVNSLFYFQLPSFVICPGYSEIQYDSFIYYYKEYSFVVSFLAGIITPTVDVPTQLTFIVLGNFFYFYVILSIKKDGILTSNNLILLNFFLIFFPLFN